MSRAVCQIPDRWGVFRTDAQKCQSRETDIDGGISKVGDGMVRTALYEASQSC